MKKKITVKWLKSKNACIEGIKWFKNQEETNSIKVLNKLIENKLYDWANWLMMRLMTYEQYVSYAVFAAEQVIDIYEKKYPNDNRPRNAIDAAKKCITSPTNKNKTAAAYAAAYATDATDAVDAAADAADVAAAAAYAAAYDAAYDAAAYDATVYDAAAEKMKLKILRFGLTELKNE